MLPALVVLAAFNYYPLAQSARWSFYSWNLLGEPRYLGWENYASLFSAVLFRRSLLNTGLFTLGVVMGTYVLALVSALLVNQRLFLSKPGRTLMVLPTIIPMVIAGFIWRWIYQPRGGLLNNVLALVGIEGPLWLFDGRFALPSIMVVSIWKDFGIYMLVLFGGLQQIPEDIHEAALIDTATPWQRFRYVTFPMLRPANFFVVLLAIFNSFRVFDQVWVMTEGGPGNATQTIVTYIYTRLFTDVGFAAAASIVLFVLLMVVTLMQLRWARAVGD